MQLDFAGDDLGFGEGASAATETRPAVAAEFAPFVQDLAGTTLSKTDLDAGAPDSTTDLTRLAMRTLQQRRYQSLPETAAELVRPRRHIVFAPSAQSSSGTVVKDSLRKIHDHVKGDKVIRSQGETLPKVLDLTSTEVAILKERFPSLVVAEDVLYEAARVSPLLPVISPLGGTASAGKTITISLLGPDGEPVPNTSILLIADAVTNTGYSVRTDAAGTWRGTIHSGLTRFTRVIVAPHSTYWSRCASDVDAASMTIRLDRVTPDGWDWGHRDLRAAERGAYDGKDVTIAVIDTGVGPHPSLNVVDGMNYLAGQPEIAWQDAQQHGTHCAGIIAAAANPRSTWGWAPAVRLLSGKVLDDRGFGYESDIAAAVEWAVAQGCDVINLSLTAGGSTGFLQQQIDRAANAGVLCVAAAGNAGENVAYPARFPYVQAVSAIGRDDAYPADSIHGDARSDVVSADGTYYFAGFSNRGDEVDFCAPGVAVTSTVPATDFATVDGTSMAAPHVAGLAAVALTRNPALRQQPRSIGRLTALIDVLKRACEDLGMGRKYQGNGVPFVSKL